MDRYKIKLTGFVGYDVTLADIQRQLLDANGKPLTVEVSSIGGLVEVGTAMFNAISDYANVNNTDVVYDVLGWAESVSSYITAMKGATVRVRPNTLYMYHNPSDAEHGDYRAMRKKAEWLDKMTSLYASAYAEKSGKTEDEIRTGMDDETYLLGQEIIDAGFADELVSNGVAEMVASKDELVKISRDEYAKALMMVSSRGQKEKPALQPKNKNTDEVTMSDEKKKDENVALDMERKRSRACMAAMAALPKDFHEQIQKDFDAGKGAEFFNGMVGHATMAGVIESKKKEQKTLEMAGRDSDDVPNLNVDQNAIKPQSNVGTPGRRGQKVEVG